MQIEGGPIHRCMLGRTTIDHIDFAVDDGIAGRTVVPFREDFSGCPANNDGSEGIPGNLLCHGNGQVHILSGGHVLLSVNHPLKKKTTASFLIF